MTEPTKDQKIWQVVAAIPPGCVASYGQIADMAAWAGRPGISVKLWENSQKGTPFPGIA
ncbi:hypothetical protein AU15_01315 [Marinobacter salarius]|uniref:Methylated-DNA-[protein]-cysteine S-methyltransferase DNA binding domain-containing protein n=1 Tax=Marinobacter salarius TaxID=1420917 RepID=W5YVU2_9GAMM|nr:hypothetical protein AU15_01315 [Marinobacter salarius]